jgi:phage tail-like protein
MSLNNTAADGATWPMPTFTFLVTFGNALTGIPFQQVSGMETEPRIIDYRNSNSPVYEPIHMPGIAKIGNVTMKRGLFVKDNAFWNWYSQISMNTLPRYTIIIKLTNEKGEVSQQWQLGNAWITKISAPTLKSDGNEVAIESIEIAYEQLTMSNGK